MDGRLLRTQLLMVTQAAPDVVPPAITVVIPAFNPGAHLQRAVASVLAQTHTDWELVVVDDGGVEDLSWVEDCDPRVRLLRQANAGVSVARNVGVAATTAPLIAFLDQDDEWLPTKLNRQARAMADGGAALCYSAFTWVWPDGTQDGNYTQPVTYESLLRDDHLCMSSVMVARDQYLIAGGHDPRLAMMQDYDLFLRLLMDGAPAVGVSERLVRYYLHGANASRDYLSAYRERTGLLRAHQRRAQRRDRPSLVAACRAGHARSRSIYGSQAYDAFRASLRGAGFPGIAHLARSLRWQPSVVAQGLSSSARRRFRSMLRGEPTARP